MRAILSIVGLLVVAAVIGFIAKQQLRAVPSPPAAAASVPGDVSQGSAKQVEQQVQQDVQRALQQGAATTASAADQ